MTIFENLWYGNVRPIDRAIVRGSKLDNLMNLLCQNEDDLMKGLTDKQKESFDKFKDCQLEITDYLELSVSHKVQVYNENGEVCNHTSPFLVRVTVVVYSRKDLPRILRSV